MCRLVYLSLSPSLSVPPSLSPSLCFLVSFLRYIDCLNPSLRRTSRARLSQRFQIHWPLDLMWSPVVSYSLLTLLKLNVNRVRYRVYIGDGEMVVLDRQSKWRIIKLGCSGQLLHLMGSTFQFLVWRCEDLGYLRDLKAVCVWGVCFHKQRLASIPLLFCSSGTLSVRVLSSYSGFGISGCERGRQGTISATCGPRALCSSGALGQFPARWDLGK